MKPTKLSIKNIGKIASEIIEINKPLILFYGEIKQGKSTILNCVRWVCGGEFPEDIIRHGEKDGAIELHFDGGMIARSFYRAKDGVTKARAVQFVKAGRPVASPVAEIKRLLNPFLLDQDFLRNKTELERKQYFNELFQVDTASLDTELFNGQRQATELRAKIAGYGDIDLTKREKVDVDGLQAKLAAVHLEYGEAKAALERELAAINDKYESDCTTLDKVNEATREANNKVFATQARRNSIEEEITRQEAVIEAAQKRIVDLKRERAGLPTDEVKPIIALKPPQPDRRAIQKKILELPHDTAALETAIREAGAANVRAEQYQANVKKDAQRKADEAALRGLESRQREIKAEKQTKLKTIGETCGIKGLEFDETGNFIYDGTTAGMISDSQIMRLSSELSALYPEGFGLDLIDRAESLGKSIFEFVDKAKAENKSILATIVGEKPAKVPADVGVFVVDNGKISGELL